MKLTSFILKAAFCACCAWSMGLQATARTTYIVAVGLNKYENSNCFAQLECPVNDVRAFANFYRCYNGSNVVMLTDHNATRKGILHALERQFSKATADDEIIFAYSGHGLPGYLSAYDSKGSLSTLISYDEVQHIMKKAKANRKMIFAMSCHAGCMTLQPANDLKNRPEDDTNVLTFVSCRPHEEPYEVHGMRNTFFFSRVMEALKGQADYNKDRKVTAREMFSYVNGRVIMDTQNTQHPQMRGNFKDNMVIVNVKNLFSKQNPF